MALKKIDSFDHYATAQIQRKWTFIGAIVSTIGSGGRNGTNAYNTTSYSYDGLEEIFSDHATWICGMAFKQTELPTGNARLISFYDSATSQIYLYLTTAGLLGVARGDGTSLAVGTTVISPNIFYYIEFKATINNSTGSFVVRINSVDELNLTSQDTQNSGNATANKVRIFGMQTSGQGGIGSLDDVYICDGSGTTNNDFLGDIRIEAIFPTGNGNSSQLVGSDADSTDNYLLVDEATPNSDTDYVESPTVGNKDTYVFGNVTPTAGTVYGIQVIPFAKKTDAGAKKIASIARLSATEEDSADKTLSTDYQYLLDVRETKPGGGAWTISDVNSAEFGVKVTV